MIPGYYRDPSRCVNDVVFCFIDCVDQNRAILEDGGGAVIDESTQWFQTTVLKDIHRVEVMTKKKINSDESWFPSRICDSLPKVVRFHQYSFSKTATDVSPNISAFGNDRTKSCGERIECNIESK